MGVRARTDVRTGRETEREGESGGEEKNRGREGVEENVRVCDGKLVGVCVHVSTCV